jgi:hypothetical protein
VEDGKRLLCIRRDGSVAFESPSSTLGRFRDGLAPCEVKRAWRYLTPDGEVAFDIKCTAAGEFSEGLAGVLVAGKVGFIDRTGAFAIPPQFGMSGAFTEGLCSVTRLDDDPREPFAYGFVDPSGGMRIPFQFGFADAFSEGLAPVLPQGKTRSHSYIDPSGVPVIGPLRCEVACPFRGGLARIQLGDAVGYIDRTGRFVWPLQK